MNIQCPLCLGHGSIPEGDPRLNTPLGSSPSKWQGSNRVIKPEPYRLSTASRVKLADGRVRTYTGETLVPGDATVIEEIPVDKITATIFDTPEAIPVAETK